MATGAELDRQGRVLVEPDLSLPGHPEIFVLGDLAHVPNRTILAASWRGTRRHSARACVASLIARRLRGEDHAPFRYRDRGSMAVIGRSAAVAQLGRLRLHGFVAWLAWLFIHLMYLVEFENRLLVLMQWGWNYRALKMSTAQELITKNSKSRDQHALCPPQATPKA